MNMGQKVLYVLVSGFTVLLSVVALIAFAANDTGNGMTGAAISQSISLLLIIIMNAVYTIKTGVEVYEWFSEHTEDD